MVKLFFQVALQRYDDGTTDMLIISLSALLKEAYVDLKTNWMSGKL